VFSCSIWFSAPSFWVGGGLESCCVGRVYGADGPIEYLRTYLTVLDDVHIELHSYNVQLLWRFIRRRRHSVTRLTLADYLYYTQSGPKVGIQ